MHNASDRSLFAPGRTFVAVIVALLGILGCTGESNSPSSEVPPVELRSDTAWESEYNDMVSVLGLSEDESQYLRAAFEQRETEGGAWLKGERGVRLAKLEGALKVAAKNKNLAETKRIISLAGPLRNELTGLLKTHEANILGSLSSDRQVQWQGHKVAEKLLGLMRPQSLDYTQEQYVRNGAVDAFARALQTGQINPSAAAFLELERWAEDAVLSEEQWQGYQDVKKKAPVRSLGI